MILSAFAGKPLPIYGDGSQVRAIGSMSKITALLRVAVYGELVTYNIGGHNERTNLQVVEPICTAGGASTGKPEGIKAYADLITFVTVLATTSGYAIDAGKSNALLGWRPTETFDSGIRKLSPGISD